MRSKKGDSLKNEKREPGEFTLLGSGVYPNSFRATVRLTSNDDDERENCKSS